MRMATLHYGTSEIDLRVAVFHSGLIRVSSCIEKARVLSDEDARRRNIASVRRCGARPFRAARFMVCAAVRRVARKSVNDNQIQPGQRNGIAARARLDRRGSIKCGSPTRRASVG